MKPFRAPRSTGEKTQEKDSSERFKDMERWVDKNLIGEGRRRRVKAREAKQEDKLRHKDTQTVRQDIRQLGTDRIRSGVGAARRFVDTS